MRNGNTRKAVLMVVGTAALFAGGDVLGQGYVDLEVSGGNLVIAANTKDCNGNLNCIKTTKGNALDLDFKLNKACKDGGPEYKLDSMQLSMVQLEPDPAKPGTSRKAFGRYILPAIVQQDFDALPDGTIQWGNTAGNNNKLHDDKIKIRDRNEGAYVVFFKIVAVPCDPQSQLPPIELDPRIENTGLN